MTIGSPPSLVNPGQPTARAHEARRGRTGRVEIAEWLVLLIALAYLGGRSLPRGWGLDYRLSQLLHYGSAVPGGL